MSEEVKLYVVYQGYDDTLTSSVAPTTYPKSKWRVVTIPANHQDFFTQRRYPLAIFNNYWLAYGEAEKRNQGL